jgi:hypothetical protein
VGFVPFVVNFSAAERIRFPMNRLHQIILIGSTVLGSWLGMQAMHEAGHVVGAWMTGGHVARVVLYPLTISRTDLAHNPCPLVVVWSGPLVGVFVPVMIWAIARACRAAGAFVLRFFAGFSLLANGLYIGIGSFGGIGDCGEMLRNGSELWQLWLFGALAAPTGLWLWYGLSAYFGIGPANRPIPRRVAYGTLIAFMALIALGLIVGGY